MRLYQLLSELPSGTLDWSRVLLIWGDERNVPADHPDSNFRMVRENLLERVPIPAANVLAVPDPGGSAAVAADAYQRLILKTLGAVGKGPPRLDCVLLGMGDDVHTASLFPGSPALNETQRIVVDNWVDKFHTSRITLTAPWINSAKHVAFLISGAGKCQALQALWHGDRNPDLYPAQRIRPENGQLWFLLDQGASQGIATPDGALVESFVKPADSQAARSGK